MHSAGITIFVLTLTAHIYKNLRGRLIRKFEILNTWNFNCHDILDTRVFKYHDFESLYLFGWQKPCQRI